MEKSKTVSATNKNKMGGKDGAVTAAPKILTFRAVRGCDRLKQTTESQNIADSSPQSLEMFQFCLCAGIRVCSAFVKADACKQEHKGLDTNGDL